MRWKEKLRYSRFFTLFNLTDDLARGRCVMLGASILENIIGWLTTGMFYTGFLMIYGIDIVNVGILSFIPFIASCFSIFSPSILERIARRRLVLALAKTAYFTLNIAGVTILPVLVTAPGPRIALFVLIILVANIINALFASGYTVWHVRFIPNSVRADFFGLQQILTSFLGIGVALISSIAADALAGSPHQNTILIALRYIAFVFALLDVLVLSLPKEYPYAKSAAHPRLRDIFVKPIGHRKFMYTMLIVFLITYFNNVPAASLNYYLLDSVGVSYTYIQVINMFWPVLLLVCMPATRRMIAQLGWFKTFAYSTLLLAPTYVLYAFVNAGNYLWLMSIVRLSQHTFGVAHSVSNANMVYINLPREDQTNYTAFHLLITNVAGLLGMATGTAFVAAFGQLHLSFFGFEMMHVQLLLLVQAVGFILTPLLLLSLLSKIPPDDDA